VASPDLWRELCVSEAIEDVLLRKTELWLKRSRGCLKSLKFHARGTGHSSSETYKRLLAKVFSFDNHRIARSLESLSYDIPSGVPCLMDFRRAVFQSQNLRFLRFSGPMFSLDVLLNRLPSLRVLEGVGTSTIDYSRSTVSPVPSKRHPLASLSLFLPQMEYRDDWHLGVVLEDLEDLTLFRVPSKLNPLFYDQKLWPNLRLLRMKNLINPPEDVSSLKLEMPRLSLLELDRVKGKIRRILRHAAMPELETVRIDSVLHFDREDLEFLAQSSPKLRELSIRSVPLDEDSLLACLPSWPDLRVLDLRNTSITNRVIELLPTATPLLERLNVSGCAVSGGPLIRLVSARYDENAKRSGIRELSMLDCRGIEPEAIEWLKKALKNVAYRYQDPNEAARSKRVLL
jgi:hypothetical protein